MPNTVWSMLFFVVKFKLLIAFCKNSICLDQILVITHVQYYLHKVIKVLIKAYAVYIDIWPYRILP